MDTNTAAQVTRAIHDADDAEEWLESQEWLKNHSRIQPLRLESDEDDSPVVR